MIGNKFTSLEKRHNIESLESDCFRIGFRFLNLLVLRPGVSELTSLSFHSLIYKTQIICVWMMGDKSGVQRRDSDWRQRFGKSYAYRWCKKPGAWIRLHTEGGKWTRDQNTDLGSSKYWDIGKKGKEQKRTWRKSQKGRKRARKSYHPKDKRSDSLYQCYR